MATQSNEKAIGEFRALEQGQGQMRSSSLTCILGLFILSILMGCAQDREDALNSTLTPPPSCEARPEMTHAYSVLPGSIISSPSRPIVAALAFSPDAQDVWIAYIHEEPVPGQLVKMHLSDWKVMHTLELASLNTRFTRFNGDATLIASVSRIPCPAHPNSSCVEPRVWKTDSGDLTSALSPALTDIHDLAFTKEGDWLVAVLGPGLNIFSPPEETRGIGKVFSGGEEKIVVGTINDSGNLVASGTDRKYIEVEEWDGQHLHDIYPWNFGPWNFKGGEVKIDAIPIKLAISPDNKWLAVQHADGLELRDLSNRFIPQHGRVTLEHSSDAVMQFNPSNSVLAVRTATGLEVFSIPNLQLMLRKPTAQVTALAFSPDGCLLAWGDVEGTVHIINAPKP